MALNLARQSGLSLEAATVLADKINRVAGWHTDIKKFEGPDGTTQHYLAATCSYSNRSTQPYRIHNVAQWNAIRNVAHLLK